MKMTIGAPKLLCITVGEELTRIVEMEKNAKNPHIHHAFSIPTPPETVQDGYVTMNEAFSTSFRRACLEHGVTATSAAFTMDSPKIVSRDVVIPQIPEKKIPAMIASNATDYFPIDITQHKLVWSIADRAVGENSHQMRLTVYAIPHDLIRSYMRFARALSLEVHALDCVGNSVVQTIKIAEREGAKAPSTHHVNLYLSCGEGCTVMTFRRGGVTELQRTVNFPFSEVMRTCTAMLERDGSYKVVNILDEMMGRELLYPTLADASVARNRRQSGEIDPRAPMTEALRPLISALKRNLDYFFEQANDSDLVVTGHVTDLGACLNGFDALLEAELEIPVEPMVVVNEKKYLVGEAAQFESPFAAYASVIGGGIAPLAIAERVKRESIKLPVFFSTPAAQRSVMALCGVVCMVCVGISVCLYFLPMSENAILNNRYDKLSDQIASLGNPKQHYDNYEKANALAKEVLGLELAMDTYNNHLVSFLEELETKMPKSFKAASFSVSETGVNMSVQVGSKQEAIFVIQTLRGMKSVSINSISGITETNSSGTNTLSMANLMSNTSADEKIDVQAYLDMAYAMQKITRAEYEAYCKGNCTQAELDKLKGFRDSGTITQEQYEAVLDFIDEKKKENQSSGGSGGGSGSGSGGSSGGASGVVKPGVSGDTLMSEADIVSYLQMALMMNRITQEQYDRYIAGQCTPEDMELLEGYYRTGIINENQYNSILAYIEAKKNGGSTDDPSTSKTVVSFTVSLSYTGQFADMETEAPETLDPSESAPESGTTDTGAQE